MNPPGQYIAVGRHISYVVPEASRTIDCGEFAQAQRLALRWNSEACARCLRMMQPTPAMAAVCLECERER